MCYLNLITALLHNFMWFLFCWFGLLKSGSLIFQVNYNVLGILIMWEFWGRLGGGRQLNQLLSGWEHFWGINWTCSQKKTWLNQRRPYCALQLPERRWQQGGVSLFFQVLRDRSRGKDFKVQKSKVSLDIRKKNSSPKGLSNTGTGCLGKRLSYHLWRYLKLL